MYDICHVLRFILNLYRVCQPKGDVSYSLGLFIPVFDIAFFCRNLCVANQQRCQLHLYVPRIIASFLHSIIFSHDIDITYLLFCNSSHCTPTHSSRYPTIPSSTSFDGQSFEHTPMITVPHSMPSRLNSSSSRTVIA